MIETLVAFTPGLATLIMYFAGPGSETPVPVEVVRTEAGWQLLRNGQPHSIRGAGWGDPNVVACDQADKAGLVHSNVNPVVSPKVRVGR